MKISLDSNLLLDLLLDQDNDSIEKLRKLLEKRHLFSICYMVYGELVPFFTLNNRDINLFLSEMDISVEGCSLAEYSYAGKKWHEYSRKKITRCPTCGKQTEMICKVCGGVIKLRQHILADFVVGAYSELRCHALLTRDYGYYQTYFPRLKLL